MGLNKSYRKQCRSAYIGLCMLHEPSARLTCFDSVGSVQGQFKLVPENVYRQCTVIPEVFVIKHSMV